MQGMPGMQPPLDMSKMSNMHVPGPNPDPNCGKSFCTDLYGETTAMLPTHGHALGIFHNEWPAYAKGFQLTGAYKPAPAVVPSYMFRADGVKDALLHPRYSNWGKASNPPTAMYQINDAGMGANFTMFHGVAAPPAPGPNVAFQMGPAGQYWMTPALPGDKMKAAKDQNDFYFGAPADIQDGTCALEQALINRKK